MSLAESNGVASEHAFPLVYAGTDKARRYKWLWKGRIALGVLTILEGRKGVGKSTVAAAIAAAMTGGPKLPGRRSRRVQGPVLWLTLEEDYPRSVWPRIRAAGGDVKQLARMGSQGENGQAKTLAFPGCFDQLEHAIVSSGAKLVVLDPLASFIPGINQNDEQQMRTVLEPLAAIAARTDCAILILRHVTKARRGQALDQGIGSVAIAAVARSVLRLERRQKKRGHSVLAQVANNLGPLEPSLVIELLEACLNVATVGWRGEADEDADDLAADSGDAGEEDERVEAKDLLRAIIGKRWVAYTDIMVAARKAGVSERTLRRAKATLDVPYRRRGFGKECYSEWGPPPAGWPLST